MGRQYPKRTLSNTLLSIEIVDTVNLYINNIRPTAQKPRELLHVPFLCIYILNVSDIKCKG